MIIWKPVALTQYSEITEEGLAYVDNPVESDFPGHWLPISIIKRIMEMRVRTTNAFDIFKTSPKVVKKPLSFLSHRTVIDKLLLGEITKSTEKFKNTDTNTKPTNSMLATSTVKSSISFASSSFKDTDHMKKQQEQNKMSSTSTTQLKTSPDIKTTIKLTKVDSTITKLPEILKTSEMTTEVKRTTENLPSTTKIEAEILSLTTKGTMATSTTSIVEILSSTTKGTTTTTPALSSTTKGTTTTTPALTTTSTTTTTETPTVTTPKKTTTTETGNPFY